MKGMAHRAGLATLLALLLILGSGELAAQSDPGQANASVVFGISLTNTGPLSFGQIVSPLSAGTVSISTTPNSGAWTQGGTLPTIGGLVQPAAFTVNKVGVGGGNPKFWVEVPSSLTLQRTGGGATMLVNAINANVSANCLASAGSSPSGGSGGCPSSNAGYNLLVGGTLNVGANQLAGSYTETFFVTVHRF